MTMAKYVPLCGIILSTTWLSGCGESGGVMTTVCSTLVTRESSGQPSAFPVVIYPPPGTNEVYVDPLIGLHLDSVYADGEAVQPTKSAVLFDELNTRRLKVPGAFIYHLRPYPGADSDKTYRLIVMRDLGQLYAEEYIVPTKARKLVLAYRMMSKEGIVGPALKMYIDIIE